MCASGEGSGKANEDGRESASLDFSLHDLKGGKDCGNQEGFNKMKGRRK